MKMKFDIVVFRYLPTAAADIFCEFLTTRYEKFSRKIQLHEKPAQFERFIKIKSSGIFFVPSLEDLINLQSLYFQRRQSDEAIKYFVYIPNLTHFQLKSSKVLTKFKYLIFFSTFLLQYTFFIIDEPEAITLSTIEWFQAEKCGQAQLIKVNTFDKKSWKWIKKLENYEKFLEYNGCELVLMVTVPVDGVISDVSNYAIVNEDQTNFEVKGIVSKVFEIAAKAHNFSSSYQPAVVTNDFIFVPDYSFVRNVLINGKEKVSSVYFCVAISNSIKRHLFTKRSHTFVDTSFRIFVTPGELYTPYEKLFLPFDLETWIMLVVTFLATFLSILVINRLSKSTQTIVYGHRVYTPFWNVVSIFFGISLIRLPSKNFSRFILILFVFFCLIFRTCYQSKLFEFMTKEPRRPPPQTVEDLIENNYTLILMEEHNIESLFSSYGKKINIRIIEGDEFYKMFRLQSQNSSAKLALFVDELVQNHIESVYNYNNNWNQLEGTFFVSHDSFVFHASVFHFRMFRKLINRLIDTGVMKYLSDNYYTKAPKFDPIYSKPEVLSLDDMMFGFNIWLGFCGISLAGFFSELFYRVFTKRYRKVKFTKIHPQVVAANDSVCELKAETNKKFRAIIKTPPMKHPVGFKMEVPVEIHNFVDNSKVDECEDKDTNVEENEHEIANPELKSIPKGSNMKGNSQNYDEIEEIIDLEDLLD